MGQLALPLDAVEDQRPSVQANFRERLAVLLRQDLDFEGQYAQHATHNLHPFPAKFPPQLPRKFIQGLTEPGDVVLDPMMGSGTTVLEAHLEGRQALGFDIDPLALLLSQVKLTPLPLEEAHQAGAHVLSQARGVMVQPDALEKAVASRFDAKTRAFIDYWFPPASQQELMALVQSIDTVSDDAVRAFLSLTLSAVIITKSGGVSLARDLAHTRPHRVEGLPWRSPLALFEKRLAQNLACFQRMQWTTQPASVQFGNTQSLPLPSNSVDLIVTSPPYASNAIDYMRAHKFSLVWLGYPIDTLSQCRKECVGGEALDQVEFVPLPEVTEEIVTRLAAKDTKKSRVLHRYYSEMTRVLSSLLRVLKPGKAAILVVGTSTLKGTETHVQNCLADIGQALGFDVVDIATRKIDRNRRMMPARHGPKATQIEERMHEEYIIGLYKPNHTEPTA